MSNYLGNEAGYWDKRYRTEDKIWGELPSVTAYHALDIFREAKLKSILVPGSGYGRHTRFFSSSGFKVTGIEISAVALNLARQFDPLSRFYHASVLDMSSDDNKYDAIFCFNVLHLFREKERGLLIRECDYRLNEGGCMFFTVFSEKEPDYGKGKEVERNTFESRPGRPAHYFTEEDLRGHFATYNVIEAGVMEDPEDHGGNPHIHILRYIYAGLSR